MVRFGYRMHENILAVVQGKFIFIEEFLSYPQKEIVFFIVLLLKCVFMGKIKFDTKIPNLSFEKIIKTIFV